MLVALFPAAAALLPPLAPFHGPSAAARCGATPLPISMLLRPPDALGIQRKLRLQLLQRRIGSSSDGEQAGPQYDEVEEEEEDEEPFDPKMQYYIELKVQDVLDERERDALAAAREAEGVEAPSDALVQPLVKHAASRRQMAGPWTPACGAPPLPGLSFHEQHRMEQRVYGGYTLPHPSPSPTPHPHAQPRPDQARPRSLAPSSSGCRRSALPPPPSPSPSPAPSPSP